MTQLTSLFYLYIVLVSISAELVSAQEDVSCYGPGSIAASVLLTILFTAILMVGLNFLWKKYRKQRKEHLILETDAEKGKNEFAFDNPGFKDAGFTPINKAETGKKWNQWSPLSAFTTKSEKKKPLDDSAIDGNEVKVVALRSHDFTGLGFNICGNMKNGIFIKDVLHRGPASESGKLNSGDRINSVTISFEHMVYEDALTILSYASPYEIIIEAKGGRIFHQNGGQGAQLSHPMYKSSSYTDLLQGEKGAKKRLFIENISNSSYSSLQKSRSNMTTLERKESKSPMNQLTNTTNSKGQLNPEQLKIQLEQKILSDHQTNLKNKNNHPMKIEEETQKSENKFQKFGIRVLPPEQQKTQKNFELSQNDNNINIEKHQGIDEVDKKMAPQAKKRGKKQMETTVEKKEDSFMRQNSVNGSGIKRDKDGIPQEIPNYMMNAAVAAKTNRKNSEERTNKEEVSKKKGKAPAPPEPSTKNNFDEIHLVTDETDVGPKENEIDIELRNKESQMKDYNSDSDIEIDNQSSVNTIELNSSDITIHHAKENEDNGGKQNRRTASTGDLTKIQKSRSNTTGTLERAQSLDITDSGIPTLEKKRTESRIEDIKSDEDLFGNVMISKEPRLSLILDGLNTFQRNRLKKSTEWGNLEDAILKLNQEDQESLISNETEISKKKEFDALVHKINEIKRESSEMDNIEIVKPERKIKNQIWPSMDLGYNGKKAISNGFNKVNSIETHIIDKLDIDELDLTEATCKEENNSKINVDLNESKTKKRFQNNIWPINENREQQQYEKRQQKPLITEQILPPIEDDLPKYESVIDDKITSTIIVPEIEKIVAENKSDEIKTNSMYNKNDTISNAYLMDATKSFIFTEKITSSNNNNKDDYIYKSKEDTNISDDIKVSRHSLGSLERPKSDDVKSILNNISNVIIKNDINNTDMNVIEQNDSIEESNAATINDKSVMLQTVTVNTFDNDIVFQSQSSSLNLEIVPENDTNLDDVKTNDNKTQTMTYITEIQVLTPNSKNISEIEIIPNNNKNNKNVDDSEFEDYLKKFESNEKFDNLEDSKSLIIQTIDAEKELHKIQEIAEEQLKKLPEMRFTTSSYESVKIPEKRQSQIELLRSNFEKSPKSPKIDVVVTKSRIPIATITKTPPTSPERRDSRNLDIEHDKAILELMSTPPKYQNKSPFSKNVTVTSIRTNSKIPSGLPILGGGSGANKPPIPPKRQETDDNIVHVSTNGTESNFKQWVFNPSDNNNSVTNIVVTEGKQQK